MNSPKMEKPHLKALMNDLGCEPSEVIHSLLGSSKDFFAILDRNLVYRAANEIFCDFTGMQMNRIIAHPDADIFSSEAAQKLDHENSKILEHGSSLEREEERIVGKTRRWWKFFKYPVIDRRGAVAGIIWTGRDITEFKRLKSKLVQLQKLESIGPLAAGIAHEINTPLGIILGYAQLIKEDLKESDPFFEEIMVIENQTKVCRKIVSDLLRFSRQTESDLSVIDLNEMVDEVASVVESLFEQELISLRKDYSDNPIYIKGDRDKLKQVIMNLLGNARDAIGEKGTIRIGTRLNRENSEAEISVADTGSGIPPEILDRIFDPFFTTKNVGKGTGLGLSVSFSIIQELGGRIEVQSPPWTRENFVDNDSAGTLFIIRLPMYEEQSENP